MIIKSLITARGGSKSVPKKNIIMLKDKPLIAYSILASLGSKVSETWVSTEDKDIKSVSIEWGAKVIDRPKEFATDTILNEPSLIQFAHKEEFDLLVFIQPTGPFIKPEYINTGIEMMMSGNYDSVFTATKKHWVPKWDKDVNPIDWDIYKRPRRQDKEEFYEETGMYYITSKKRLLKTGIRYSGKIGIVNIPSYDSLQIDSKEDLQFVEKILNSI